MKRFSLLALSTLSAGAVFAQTLQDAVKFYENERYSKAKSILISSINAGQAKAESYFYLGKCYIENENGDSARFYFQKGIAAFPQNPLNYVGMGHVFLNENNDVEAEKSFSKANTLTGTKDATTLIYVAEAQIQATNKELDKAIANLNKAIGIDKNNTLAYVDLGDAVLERSNDGSAANGNYEKAMAINPNYTKAYVQQGVLWIRAKNAELADKSLNKAIQIDPNYAPAYRWLAELQYLKKDYKGAVETFKKYMNLTDNTMDSKIRFAKFLFLSKEYTQAVEVINEILQVDPSNVILKRLSGYSLYELGKYEEGLKYLNQFIASADPKKIIASDYEYLGKLQSKNKQDSLAVISYSKVLEMDPNRKDLYDDIASVYYSAKKYSKAAEWYEKKLAESTKRSAGDYSSLGQAYYYMYQSNPSDTALLRKADMSFAKLVDLSPNFPLGYKWRGRVKSVNLENAADKAAPKPFYEKVIELGTKDEVKFKKELIEAYEYMAYFYIQTNDNTNAKASYEKILALDPENQVAKNNIKGLK